MRLFRAGIAIWATVEAFRTAQWLLLFPAGIFAIQAVFDIGCCAATGCSSPERKNYGDNSGQPSKDVVYEEVR